MKTKNKTQTILKLVLGLGLMLGNSLYAQAQLPDFITDVDDETPPGAPIDGLIGIAVLAGAIYGGKKLKDRKKV